MTYLEAGLSNVLFPVCLLLHKHGLLITSIASKPLAIVPAGHHSTGRMRQQAACQLYTAWALLHMDVHLATAEEAASNKHSRVFVTERYRRT